MKKVALIVVVVITLLAIPATVFLVGQQQEIRKRAAPASTIALVPATKTVKKDEEFSLDVRLTPASNQVVSINVRLTFDATKLEAVTIVNGPLAPTILTAGTIGAGSASVTVGAESNAQPIQTTGIVATVRLKAKEAAATPVAVRFDTSTFAGGLGEGQSNVLIGMTPANVTITNLDGTLPSEDTSAQNNEADQGDTSTPPPSGFGGAEVDTSGATESAALAITGPTDNENVASEQPTINGTARPGATVILQIYSNPITATVVADENGNWSYTVTEPLSSGPHTVNALVTDPTTGATENASISFVVAEAGIGGGSESAIPVSGTVEATIILITIGALFLISGALLPVFVQ